MYAKPIDYAAVPAPNACAAAQTVLSDRFICLRQFHSGDIQVLHAAVRESLGDLLAGMTWCHPAYSLEDSASFILNSKNHWERCEHFSFAICDVRKKTLLGSIGLSHFDSTHRYANVGYWVRTAWAGQGVATAATRLIARWAFVELNLNRLEIIVAVNNQPSQRVAEKAGAKREGLLRRRLVLRGQRLDAFMYSLVPGDLDMTS